MAERRTSIADALRQRLVAGLYLGTTRPGDRLPSVRALAPEFGADPRVVLAAYRKLEVEGLVEVRTRSGVFAAQRASTSGEVLPFLTTWVVDVLVQALSRGIPAVDFPERVRRCLKTVSLTAACVECNDDQIAGLCAELADDYGFRTRPVDLAAVRAAVVPEEVWRADVLVTTRFHADDVRDLAKRLEMPCIVVSLRPDFVGELTRLLKQGPVYFVASDARFRDKLAATFAGTPGADNLHTLLVGRDDLNRIPESAPAYVMRGARKQIEDEQLLARFVPAPRVFSEESARQLLSFVIEANMQAMRAEGGGSPGGA